MHVSVELYGAVNARGTDIQGISACQKKANDMGVCTVCLHSFCWAGNEAISNSISKWHCSVWSTCMLVGMQPVDTGEGGPEPEPEAEAAIAH